MRRLAKEGSWIVIGQIAAVAGGVVLVRVLTEYLDPLQYGRLALGLTLAGLVNQVIMGGITVGITRFYSIAADKHDLRGYLRDARRLLGFATLTVAVLGLLLLAGLHEVGYSDWMGLAAAALAFSVISGYNAALSGIQNAARQRGVVAFHGGLDAWLRILLAVAAVLLLGASSTAVVIGYTCASLVVTVSQLAFLRRTIPAQYGRPNDENWRSQMWLYSWPFLAWGGFTWMQQASDRWALETFASTEEVGRYAVLFQLGYAPIVLATSLAMTFLGPILYSRCGDATDNTRNAHVHRLSWLMTYTSLSLTVAVFFITFVIHEPLFQLLAAARYGEVSSWLPWVVMAGGLFGAGQMLALKLMTEMKSARLAAVKIGTAILGLLFNICGAAVAGIPGVVVSLLAFSIIYFAWMVWLARSTPLAQLKLQNDNTDDRVATARAL